MPLLEGRRTAPFSALTPNIPILLKEAPNPEHSGSNAINSPLKRAHHGSRTEEESDSLASWPKLLKEVLPIPADSDLVQRLIPVLLRSHDLNRMRP